MDKPSDHIKVGEVSILDPQFTMKKEPDDVQAKFSGYIKPAAMFKRSNSKANFKTRKRDILYAYSSHYKKLSLVIPMILLYIFLGAIVFDALEGGKDNDLSFLDSVYWAVVTFTTVGYGDISPNTAGGKAWAILFIFTGLTIVVTAVAYIHDLAHDLKVELNVMKREQEPLPSIENIVVSVLVTVGVMGFLIGLGSIFYAFELDLVYLDCVYLSVVTLTTVGYGDISVSTPKSRLFSLFYIIFGVYIFLGRLTMITDSVNKYVEYKRIQKVLHKGVTLELIEEMDTTGDGQLDLLEFSVGFLIRMGKINQRDVNRLKALFAKLDRDGDGHLGYDDLLDDSEKKKMTVRYSASLDRCLDATISHEPHTPATQSSGDGMGPVQGEEK
eukprot:CFRG3526T1